MAQHETTKMPVRLPQRLLSQAIFNNAIHRIFLILCITTYNFALKSFARFTFYTKNRQIYQIYGHFS